MAKHCLECFDISSQSKLKLRRKRRNKIVKFMLIRSLDELVMIMSLAVREG